ncbi:MAG: hypothetical protein IJO33_04895 [Bacilli bacterium]|nr:hypothetical protein [Bacilli bacterium]
MDKVVLYNELFLCYQDLLTENEKATFLDYYADDLSLSEIADNNKVSKSAVSKTVNKVEEKLEYYENILKLNCKNKIVQEVLEKNSLKEIKKLLNDYINL